YRISGFSSISSPGTFPMIAASVMVLSIVLLMLDNRKMKKPDVVGLADELRRTVKEVLSRVFLIYTAVIIVYMILIEPLHFLPSSFVFLFVSMIYLKGSTFFKSLIISAVSLGGIYFIFQYFFRVVLP
ncbi:MAG TPA: tripartite tricarboxylate transporter TctB family protein, partial [Deltaproteobacteria bacterium]|nr:tripartite tricarboxylate transporter TctB family protein [Deltaproteobacteria bacterium]